MQTLNWFAEWWAAAPGVVRLLTVVAIALAIAGVWRPVQMLYHSSPTLTFLASAAALLLFLFFG